ncbi:V-type ATP synthase subunit D [Acidaminobacter sp.]|uniref:V-type ATP synthase subunit D n=1 Tax=Acidaminobacter sp. TaxID=1872102 RepID=UPI0013801262|nr:V-type ATP synthase subunit D [Acidaminobacter sp.]MDK9710355.1 V-type ATP synthase subunit D [Acidaminobacter sp.]MZQ97920.1 V-type ATP synthase subunit D [Acidaminobacter sp.]
MTRLNVNPTRMELTNLKRRRTTAVRGHKLLKDKQDELMRHFIEMIRENHDVRQQVEVELSRVYKSMAAARGDLSSTFVEGALMLPVKTPEVDLKLHNIMSVKLPVYRVLTSGSQNPKIGSGSSRMPSPAVERTAAQFDALLPKLVHLAEIEKSCQLMADEIEKTRRRVNALEYTTIPQLNETIRYIKMKLDENERSSNIRLMKVKSRLVEKEEA